MYFLAFSQIDAFGHFKWSLSVFWITLSMVSAMALIMLVAMGSMLRNQRLNIGLFVAFAVVLVGRAPSSAAVSRRSLATMPSSVR